MSSATQYQINHRPEPVREAVALWGKTLVYCLPLLREIQHVRFDVACLNDVIVRQIALIAMSYDRVRTQIPIDRRQQ
jgi:hypothetical protein